MRKLLAAALSASLTGCAPADQMVSWLFGLVIFAILSAVLFAKTSPRTDHAVALTRFNRITWCVAAFAAASVCIYFWATIGQSSDAPWWPYLAALASSLVGGAILMLALVWRFLRFRSKGP